MNIKIYISSARIVALCLFALACTKKSEDKSDTNPSQLATTSQRSNVVYYGNDIKLQISFDGNQALVERTKLPQGTYYSPKLYNLPLLNIINGQIQFDQSKKYWYISFTQNEQAMSVGGNQIGNQPDCVSKTCTGTCELTKDTNGCFICNCTGGTGDCDMKIGAKVINGGLIIEVDSVYIVEYQ